MNKPTKDQDVSWKGSPNAGKVLAILAGVSALVLLLSGFIY